MKAGFTGTQVGTTLLQLEQIENILKKHNVTEVHHGDCIGADYDLHCLARLLQLRIIVHPPIDSKKRAFTEGDASFPKKDYISRNHDIVDLTDVLIAAPKSQKEQIRSGTWATIRYAKKCNKLVIVVYPDGKITIYKH